MLHLAQMPNRWAEEEQAKETEKEDTEQEQEAAGEFEGGLTNKNAPIVSTVYIVYKYVTVGRSRILIDSTRRSYLANKAQVHQLYRNWRCIRNPVIHLRSFSL